MSNITSTCISDIPPSLLPNITTCQSTATSPFCWPPNGTRICVPAPSGIPIYWPSSYYPESSRVLIEWDLSSTIFPASYNTGNKTQAITQYMYEKHALTIAGAPESERNLKLYMRSRVDGGEVMNHEGPTLVLVKTAEFTSTRASGSSKPTATGRTSSKKDDDDDEDKDPLSGLTSGAMAGVIIGILVGVIAIVALSFFCGCCACCGVKPRSARASRIKVDEEEQAKIVAQGVELMEQKGGNGGVKSGEATVATLNPGRGMGSEEIGVARTTGDDGDQIRRVELDAGRDRGDPPPKYTP